MDTANERDAERVQAMPQFHPPGARITVTLITAKSCINIQRMNGLYGDAIPLATIEQAKATLPPATSCSEWIRVVDAVSQKGAMGTLEFERRHFGPTGSPSGEWRWEVVYCYAALAGKQLRHDIAFNHRCRS